MPLARVQWLSLPVARSGSTGMDPESAHLAGAVTDGVRVMPHRDPERLGRLSEIDIRL